MTNWLLVAILLSIFSPSAGILCVAVFAMFHMINIGYRSYERYKYAIAVKEKNNAVR